MLWATPRGALARIWRWGHLLPGFEPARWRVPRPAPVLVLQRLLCLDEDISAPAESIDQAFVALLVRQWKKMAFVFIQPAEQAAVDLAYVVFWP